MPKGRKHQQQFFQPVTQRSRRFSKRAPAASEVSSEVTWELLLKLTSDVWLSSLRICLTSEMVFRPVGVGAFAQTLFVIAALVSITMRPSPSARATIASPSVKLAARRTAIGRTKRPWGPRLNADTSVEVDMAITVSEVPLKAIRWHELHFSGTRLLAFETALNNIAGIPLAHRGYLGYFGADDERWKQRPSLSTAQIRNCELYFLKRSTQERSSNLVNIT